MLPMTSSNDKSRGMRALWTGRLWRPPHEALDALGSTLGGHWRAARDRTLRLFSTRVSWLEAHRGRSSGSPPDQGR
jgi:hypothetical protein